MTRMIERWFPSAEVSANSVKGWGSGNQERGLFTWFAARPVAQATAAVPKSSLTSGKMLRFSTRSVDVE